MASPNLSTVVAWVEREYPTLPRIQITNCRRIAGSSSWSQHSWSNAADIFVNLNTGNQLAKRLRERFGPWIKTLLWQVPDHYDHIHVDMWPTGISTPPCAGGLLRVRHKDGTTGGTFTDDITPIGDDTVDFIISVFKGQNMAFYRALQAKTGVPGGNADYWGSDYTGTKPNDQEWRDAADDLFGAALQVGVFAPPPATGTVDQVARAAAEKAKQALARVKSVL